MPITSKYTNQKIEQIISDVFDVLEKHDASAELALMVVGNIATNIINADVPASKKKKLPSNFLKLCLNRLNKI